MKSRKSKSAMLKLLERLCVLPLAPVSAGADEAAEILCEELPFQVREYATGREHNGWLIPQKWEVHAAEIKQKGKIIYDGKLHPLGVMGYAQSFRGSVDLKTLKEHLTYRKDQPKAIGYHCDYYYKPWLSDWGFSLPYRLYQTLKPGKYEINLRTSFHPSQMKVLDYFLEGEREETIFFNAHSCHAAQANDDISGIVVGIELMRRLALKRRKFSYRLILAPEHIGTVFYLADLAPEDLRKLKFGFFLEMLGNDNRLALQRSFLGNTLLDQACEHYLLNALSGFECRPFRKVVGNDETVWEAPGYEIPTVSLSRFPFPEYHTSFDHEKNICENRLEEAVESMSSILEILETNAVMMRNFTGLIALSNPKYDLYLKPGTDPSIVGERHSKDALKWNYLMDCLPRYFDGKMTVLDIARRHELPYASVYRYLEKFCEKKLIRFSEISRHESPLQPVS